MAQMNFDASQVDPSSSYDTFPKGDYLLCIRSTDIKPTKAGTGHYLEYEAEVLEGQYAGRKIFGRINIANQNPTAEEIGQRELSGLWRAVGVMQVSDSTQLHDKPFIGAVGIEVDKTGQYDDKNIIKKFKASALAPAMGGAAPTPVGQQAAPAPVAPAQGVANTAPPVAPAAGDRPAWAQ